MINRRQFLKLAITAAGVVVVFVVGAEEISRLTKPPSSSSTISKTSITSTTIVSRTSTSLNSSTPDYQTFIAPYLNQIELARSSTMSPPNLVGGNAFKIGYVPSMNMIAGDHTCLGDSSEQYCMIDPGYSIAVPLDRLNFLAGVPTSTPITLTYTNYLNGTWVLPVNGDSYCCAFNGNLPYSPYGWNDPRLVPFGFKQDAIYNWANQDTSCGNYFVCAPGYNDFAKLSSHPVVCVDVVDTSSVNVPNTSNGGGATAPRWSEWVLNQYLTGNGQSEATQNAINYIMNDWDGTKFVTLDPDMTCRVYGKMLQVFRALGLWQQNKMNSHGISWLDIATQCESQMFGLQVTNETAKNTGATAGQFSIAYSQIGDTGGEEMGYALTSVWDQLPSIFAPFLSNTPT